MNHHSLKDGFELDFVLRPNTIPDSKFNSSSITSSSELVSSIVHELKTPLNAIVGFSEILEDEVTNPKFAKECAYYAKEINLASQELLEIVHDLLDVGVANSGIFAFDLAQKIDVIDVVQRSIRLNWDYSLRRNIVLKLDVNGEEISAKPVMKEDKKLTAEVKVSPINLDAKRTKQILTNLISNAVKYSPAKTEVKISLREIYDNEAFTTEDFSDDDSSNCDAQNLIHKDTTNGDKTVCSSFIAETQTTTNPHTAKQAQHHNRPASLEVAPQGKLFPSALEIMISDQGFGMTKDQISCLFTPYKTFQNPNTGKVDSTGLGLSITKQLVEMQGGTILVESQPNVGTKFTLTFPYRS